MSKKKNLLFTSLKDCTVATLVLMIAIFAIGAGFSKSLAETDNQHPSSTYTQDDRVKVTKSASWRNEEKGEAQIKITVESKYERRESKIEDSDFIFIADKSKSAYSYGGLTKSQVENEVLLNVVDDILEEGRNNRIAFFEFAQGSFFYSNSTSYSRKAVHYDSYLSGATGSTATSRRAEHASFATNDVTAQNLFTQRYNEAKATQQSKVNACEFANFYSNSTDVKNMIRNANQDNSSDKNDGTLYTNIDAPLVTAKCLIDKRPANEQDRNVFVIVLSDGCPDPVGIPYYTGYGWNYVNKYKGLSSVNFGTSRSSIADNKIPVNMLFSKASEHIRNDGDYLFIIVTGTDKDVNGNVYPVWNYITHGVEVDERNNDYVYTILDSSNSGSYAGNGSSSQAGYSDKSGKDQLSGYLGGIKDIGYGIQVGGSYLTGSWGSVGGYNPNLSGGSAGNAGGSTGSTGSTGSVSYSFSALELGGSSGTGGSGAGSPTIGGGTGSGAHGPLSGGRNFHTIAFANAKTIRTNQDEVYDFNTGTVTGTGRATSVTPSVSTEGQQGQDRVRGLFSTIGRLIAESKGDPEIQCGITDVINSEVFEIDGAESKAISVNVGSVKVEGNLVTWIFDKIKYGQKINGKWPTMTIKVKVKDNKAKNTWNTWLNTNSIIPEDGQLIVEHHEPSEPIVGFPVPTPWLYREKEIETGNIYANFLVIDSDGNIRPLPTIERYEDKGVDLGKQKLSLNTALKDQLIPFNCKYVGYEVAKGNIQASDVNDHGKLNSSEVASFSVSEESKDATVNYFFNEEYAKIKIVHIAVNSMGYKLIDPQPVVYDKCRYLEAKSFAASSNTELYEFVGSDVINNAVLPQYTINSKFDEIKEVSVTPNANTPYITIVFAYKENYIKTAGIEIIHWDYDRQKEIKPPHLVNQDRIAYDDVRDLVSYLDTNLSVDDYNAIVRENGVSGALQIVADAWKKSNKLNILSINPNALSAGSNRFTFIDDSKVNIGLKGDVNTQNTLIGYVATSADGQYKIDIDSLISALKYSNDKKITITLNYHVKNLVEYQHIDSRTGEIIKVGDSYPDVALYGETVRTEKEPQNIKGYTFDSSRPIEVYNKEANAVSKDTKAKIEENVLITGPIVSDVVVKLYYNRDRKITIEHYDKETKTKIAGVKDTTGYVRYGEDYKTAKEPVIKITSKGDVYVYDTYEIPNSVYAEAGRTIVDTLDLNNTSIEIKEVKDDIVVKLYYLRGRKIKIEHLDYEDRTTHIVSPEPEAKGVEFGHDLVIDTEPLDVPGYIYKEYEITNNNNSGKIEIVPENKKISLLEVKDDITIKLYYQKQKTVDVIVNHLDKTTKESIKDLERVPVVQTNDVTVSAIKEKSVSFDDPKGSNAVYVFEGVDNEDIAYELVDTDKTYDGKQNVTIKNVMNEGNKVTFYYQKYWPVVIHFRTIKNEPIPGYDDVIDRIKDGESKEFPNKVIPSYTYDHYTTSQGKEGTATKAPVDNANNSIEITFFYKRKPEVSGEIIPTIPVDPIDPEDNPFGDSDEKYIILDELFQVNLEVNNYDAADDEYDVIIEFPFDVFVISTEVQTGGSEEGVGGRGGNPGAGGSDDTTDESSEGGRAAQNLGRGNNLGKYIKAEDSIVVDTFDETATETHKDWTYTFRLPSWDQEGEYTKATLKIVEKANPSNVISQKDITIRIIGRLYDFNVNSMRTGANDSTTPAGVLHWYKGLFADKNTGREYNADTLPIGQREVKPNVSKLDYPDGSRNDTIQPAMFRYGIPLGETFAFNLKTKGLLSNKIKITPKLVYVDKNGEVQNNVKYYLNGAFSQGSLFADTDGVIISDNISTSLTTRLNKTVRAKEELLMEIAEASALKKLSNVLETKHEKEDSDIKGLGKSSSEYKMYTPFINAYKNFDPNTTVNFGNYAGLVLPNTLRLPYTNYASSSRASSTARYKEIHKIGRNYGLNTSNFGMIDRNDNSMENVLNYVVISDYKKAIESIDQFISKNVGDGKIIGSNTALENSLGHWYAEYALPDDLIVKDGAGNELKDGFIVVTFKIQSLMTIDGKDYTYLNYATKPIVERNTMTQWQIENRDIIVDGNNQLQQIYLPNVGANTEVKAKIDITDGYYPVCIYQVGHRLSDYREIVVED